MKALGGEVGEEGVVEGACGVDDGGKGMRLGDGIKQGLEVIAKGDVARSEGDVSAESFEVGLEGERALGVGAFSRREEQMFDAVGAYEMASEQSAECAGAAGDEDGAVGVEGPERRKGGERRVSRVGNREPRDEGAAVAESELMVGGVEDSGDEGAIGIVVLVGVDEEDGAVGVFGLSGAYEAPDGCVDEVGQGVVAGGGDGAVGEEDEARGGVAVVVEPRLEEGQRALGGVMGVGDEVGGIASGRRPVGEDDERKDDGIGERGVGGA